MKKILVALDGSRFSEAILTHVAAVAGGDTPVRFIHVTRPDADARRQGMAYLDEVMGREAARFERRDCVLAEGDPAEEIRHHAIREGFGLIALTTHGRSGLGRLLLGSTASSLLTTSTRPLLVARPDTEARPVKRVLVVVERGAKGTRVLPVVGELAAAGAGVTMMTAVDRHHLIAPATDSLAVQEGHLEERGVGTRVLVRVGSLVQATLEVAEREQSDVIAVEVNGNAGVAKELMRVARVPLIVARPQASRLSKRVHELAWLSDGGEWL